jgi:NAD(P)-dependent dehydrogenase (short-subunit alcohol dehydrogenase family)
MNSGNMVIAIKCHPGHLADKFVIVTGSSAGINRVIALAFAREGAKVVCSDLQPLARVDIKDEIHVATLGEIIKEGSIGASVKVDVGEAAEVEELVHKAVEHFGKAGFSAGIPMPMVY